MERKLVTIRTIDALDPIEGADAIEVATVGGWKVVVKRGEFTVGDSAVYFEVDSFLPESDERFSFLMKSGVREFEGVRGHKLRTIKLRGQLSQGLLLPLNAVQLPPNADGDLASILGIKKWEPTISPQLAGQVKGNFPSFIRKTDQERCQNLVTEIFGAGSDNLQNEPEYEVTVKLDGTSCTIYWNNGEFGVCSRNLELKVNDENKDNALIRAALDNLFNVSLQRLGRNLALQGELMGPGIQGNRENLKKPEFFLFDIYDIDCGVYLTPAERHGIIRELQEMAPWIQHVPVLFNRVRLSKLGITNIEQLLKFAEGPSLNHPVREGLVFKRRSGKFSFKAISNQFLLKEKD